MIFTKKQKQAILGIVSEMNIELDKAEKKQQNILKNRQLHKDKRKIQHILGLISKL